jgi:nicotinate-nucleotide adenylyltransferase
VKLGLMGGTFDPIHLGHLRAAENVREALALERVLFVPARVPPHRPQPAAPVLDRWAMVVLATASHPGFVPSDLELLRDGPSYTVDTVSAVRHGNPGAVVVLIIGSDNLALIPQWHDPKKLLSMVEVAVVERPGEPWSGTTPPALPAARVERVEGPTLPIASRDIRARLHGGGSVRHLLPDAVADYIAKRGLYR